MGCNFIYIFKGDDTNWNGEQFLTVNITPAQGIDISDMTAKFTLGAYKKENIPLNTGSFEIDLTAATTGLYNYGPINGTVQIFDTLGRVKTVCNTIPFYITNKVIETQNQTLNMDLPAGSPVSIDVTVGGTVSYNDLADKPSINGVTVEGAKSGYDYGLADEAGLALKVSKSGDTMTGDLVLSEGVGIDTPNAKIKEVNNKLVLGNKSNNYGLYVNPNGTGAAFVSAQGNADVLKSTDLRNTFDPNSTYPITGRGVSSAISGKQDTITGAATTITASNLSANKTLISDNNGKVAASTVTSTELGYVSGVTSAIQTQINNEVSARTNADLDLQGQIDAIAAASDVTDIVGTYAELQAYDTQHLKDNDIIKVLTDSTHDNASTYYRWSTHTQTFTYIGAEGPYYTKAEADAEFLSQENAATTYLTQANAASTYETQANATASLALKASNADDTTIVDNGTNISTVAVKEQRANVAIKQWVGTKAQYEAITTKDANTVYVITDETDVEAITVDSALSSTSIHPVQNKAVYAALQGKQDTLPAGTTGYFLQKTAGGMQWSEVQVSSAPTLTWYTNVTGTTVTISDTSSADLVKIYKNGLLLQPTEDYTISGTTLTLVTALVSTDKITVEVF